MRLNCALAVSSFLFIPIVLADSHPENHQPRFLNKKDASRVPWAGAYLVDSSEGDYTAITGSFPVPLVWDGKNSTGVAVMVGIGSMCDGSGVGFMAGIRSMLIDNVVSYAGVAQWDIQVETASNFTVTVGDFVQASVSVHSATNGTASLENLSNGQSWKKDFGVDPAVRVCRRSAEWIVETLTPMTAMPVPKFSTVSFLNAAAKTAIGATRLSGEAKVTNIEYNNIALTNVTVDENFVVVEYEF